MVEVVVSLINSAGGLIRLFIRKPDIGDLVEKHIVGIVRHIHIAFRMAENARVVHIQIATLNPEGGIPGFNGCRFIVAIGAVVELAIRNTGRIDIGGDIGSDPADIAILKPAAIHGGNVFIKSRPKLQFSKVLCDTFPQ